MFEKIKIKNKIGATAIEYGILACLLGVTLVPATDILGSWLSTSFCSVSYGFTKETSCNPMKSFLDTNLKKMYYDVASKESAYISAYNNVYNIKNKGNELNQACTAGDQDACNQYKMLYNGSLDGLLLNDGSISQDYNNYDINNVDSVYAKADKALLDAFNNLNNSVSTDLNNVFQEGDGNKSSYNDLINRYGQDAVSQANSDVLSQSFTDPTTGSQTKLSDVFYMQKTDSGDIGVHDGGLAILSDFYSKYPVNTP
jgi:Flp pilus assembly pilin Flp